MSTAHVYHMRFWLEDEDRPRMDSQIPENGSLVPWLAIARVLDGKAPASEYSPIRLVVPDDGATKWHSYTIAGTYGLLSKPVIDLIGRYMVAWFDFLDAWINDVPFFFLRKKAVLDCLDRKNSVLVPFSGEPGTIKRIDRYRFFKEKIPDPAVFPIPEIRYHLFATNSIKTKVEGAKLKGLHFQDAEHGIGP